MTEEEQIELFIKERGVTKLPDRAAAVLGETTPGWRRGVERRAEKKSVSRGIKRRLQKQLRRRGKSNG